MNILFVSQGYPNANGRGYERRAAQHLATLSTLGKVTLVIPGQAADAAASVGHDLSQLTVSRIIVRREPTLAEVTQARHDRATTRPARFLHAIRRRYNTDQFARRQDKRRYRSLLKDKFDLVFAFRIGAAVWIDSVLGKRKPQRAIVDFDDIESLALARNTAAHRKSLFWRWKLHTYISQLARTEDRLASSWPVTLVCSRHDVQLLNRRGHKAIAVPNAVQFNAVPTEVDTARLQLLFVGTLSYRPNADGIIWFVQNVWPSLHRRLQGRVDLKIVGFDPPNDVVELGSHPDVEVLGPVDDLAPVYAACNVVIVPIFSGSGTRIKILEAFAFSRPIVTTPIGCEGLDLIHDYHAMIAQTDDAFVDVITELAHSPGKRRAIALAGREYGVENFSHTVVSNRVKAIILQFMDVDRRGKKDSVSGVIGAQKGV